MAKKTLKTRVMQKHDTEANWLLATNFTPMNGEIIIYDKDDNYDYKRIKIGDGERNVNDLPFIDDHLIESIDAINEKASIQSDWNQNDENQLDYVKNKPFYKIYNENQVLVDGTFTTEIVYSTKYGIRFDGVIDKNINYELTVGDVTMSMLGASSSTVDGVTYPVLMFKNNSDIYCVGYSGNSYCIYINSATESESIYFKLIDPREYIYTLLEDDYLPKSLGREGSGTNSWAFGNNNKASGSNSHAEGNYTTASGSAAHSEGYHTTASGGNSHAEGFITIASGSHGHAEGYYTTASGHFTHAEGANTLASSNYQHVQGRYNVEDAASKYIHIVGNGTSDLARSNAHTLDWSGNAWYQGDIFVGGTGQTDEAAKKLATEDYVNTKVSDLVNSAPETLDTLGELATALEENSDIVETLNASITNKADKADVVQSDWNVNDSVSMAYIANRTHYDSYIREKELYKYTLFKEQFQEQNGVYINVWWPAEKLIDGEIYEVIDNGMVYTGLVCSIDENGYRYIGSKQNEIISGNSTYPFQLLTSEYTPQGMFITNEYANHNLEVYLVKHELKQLDEKFIPDSVKVSPDWNVNDETSTSYIANRPFYATDPVEMVLCDVVDMQYTNESMWGLVYQIPCQVTNINLSDGDLFDAIVNGVTYSGLVWNNNGNIININENMYFYYDDQDNSFYVTYMPTNLEDTTISIKLTAIKQDVVQLNEKYISYKPGKIVTRQTFTIDGEEVVAEKGAEVFNNYESNIATGYSSHAEGSLTIASGGASHAEGSNAKATGEISHAEGSNTIASGYNSHAEGFVAIASGNYSHVEGYYTKATGQYQHVQGKYNIEDTNNKYAHIVGNGEINKRSNAHTLDWSGNAWYAGKVFVGGTSQDDAMELGVKDWNVNDETNPAYIQNRPFYTNPIETVVVEETSITLQDNFGNITSLYPLEVGQEYIITLDNVAYNMVCKLHDGMGIPYLGNTGLIGQGEDTGELFFIAPFDSDTSLGIQINSDISEHTIFISTMIPEVHQLDEKYISYKPGLKTEGKIYTIDDEEVVAEVGAEIFNNYEHNIATGQYSHAEGLSTTASGAFSHAEGHYTTASGTYSHSEGNNTTASGRGSHVEGSMSTAGGTFSHAEGCNTIASGEYQHVQGKFNINDVDADGNALNTYAHIVGNGTSNSARSNAHTLDWNGNAWYAGSVEGTAIILSSPNGTRFQITVGDDGVLTATEIVEL